MTGRAAILVLVLALLAVAWASSFRAYLQQRDHMAQVRSAIQADTDDIKGLERQKRRWHDKAYFMQQARLRFNYVMPGEQSYQVLDENGRPLDSPDQLANPTSRQGEPVAWWDTVWESVELAGNPAEAGE